MLAGGLGVWTVMRSFPQTSGTLKLPGLSAAVTVARDSAGVPQITARTADDLFRAQGYVHAQDRFWEMDFRRHVTSGRLSELFGESQLPTDRFLRTLGWRAIAEQEVEALDGCPVGTMIELPRAALTAGEIAAEADFFSFGTNDLTQTTWGFSRDDVEGSFFTAYLREGVFAVSPFESIDAGGVGRLIGMAVEEGRAARPGLEMGVCGEHGGDPQSVHFFHDAGLDYVSCSPFRVPVARLEAGRAALRTGTEEGTR